MSRQSILKKYLAPAPEPKALVQARVCVSLHEEVNAQRALDDLSWQELLEACLKRYVDESKKEKSK